MALRSARAALEVREILPRNFVFPARAFHSSSSKNDAAGGVAAPAAATAAVKDSKMFCFQCEQTDKGTGCTTIGVCGKTPEVATLQDYLMHALKEIAYYGKQARSVGVSDPKIDAFVLDAMFATLTNVNFDEARFVTYLKDAQKHYNTIKEKYVNACKAKGQTPQLDSNFTLPTRADAAALIAAGREYGIPGRQQRLGADYVGLQELITYGLKGAAAYADHARVLGKTDEDVNAFMMDTLAFLRATDSTVPDLLGRALKVGEVNLKIMGMLNHGAIDLYGKPEPTKVLTTAKKGKCILVSGHDLKDLEEILKQTEGKGINVYTHGELLPAHSYPGLKKYKHLIGNYGGAWQNQKMEFALFPGPIVMTTNCIIEPKKSYKDRIFTRSTVGWPGVVHLPDTNFSVVVKSALACKGFEKDEPEKSVMTGFGHHAVLGVADKVVDLVKKGEIKHFFLIGGCDGSEGERNYFKELALGAPKDAVILTLACGKYRFNKFDFGMIGNSGIPRMLDVGQCNDSFSAIQIAAALAKAFGTDVNGLPLSFAVSWFEQKAVAVLLTLLHLGIKNIYLGPHLPAFATPNMMKVLVDTFQLRRIADPQADLKNMLAKK